MVGTVARACLIISYYLFLNYIKHYFFSSGSGFSSLLTLSLSQNKLTKSDVAQTIQSILTIYILHVIYSLEMMSLFITHLRIFKVYIQLKLDKIHSSVCRLDNIVVERSLHVGSHVQISRQARSDRICLV